MIGRLDSQNDSPKRALAILSRMSRDNTRYTYIEGYDDMYLGCSIPRISSVPRSRICVARTIRHMDRIRRDVYIFEIFTKYYETRARAEENSTRSDQMKRAWNVHECAWKCIGCIRLYEYLYVCTSGRYRCTVCRFVPTKIAFRYDLEEILSDKPFTEQLLRYASKQLRQFELAITCAHVPYICTTRYATYISICVYGYLRVYARRPLVHSSSRWRAHSSFIIEQSHDAHNSDRWTFDNPRKDVQLCAPIIILL